jgi:predicted phosphodiesterase
MVLEFPMLADYALLSDNRTLFLTHGHLYNKEILPPLQKGDLLLNGHFHSPEQTSLENGAIYINCGSVSLPKDGTPHSYIVYENGSLTWYDLETGGMFDCLTLD